jgi:hypothetical protein
MKYFVCFPKGGIADTFNVISNCLNYCIKYNRILIIYTNNQDWIHDSIEKYITFTHPNIYIGDMLAKIRELEKTSIYPRGLTYIENLKSEYYNKINRGYYIYLDKNKEDTDDNLVYGHTDLTKNYDENVVIYCNCWGNVGKTILNYIKINKLVLDVYNKRMSKLSDNYISIHIRNTDIITENLDEFLNSINDKIVNNNYIFLASDNKKTIDYIKNLYGNKIYNYAKITDNYGKNMHYYYDKTQITNEELVIDCLVDLLMLSSGKEIYYSSSASNYSKTAEYLCNNKHILKNILDTNI